jgi:hypothetical protein
MLFLDHSEFLDFGRAEGILRSRALLEVRRLFFVDGFVGMRLKAKSGSRINAVFSRVSGTPAGKRKIPGNTPGAAASPAFLTFLI